MADLNSLSGLHYEMMKRCYNEKSVMYSCYGAKGIKVCEEWHDRDTFKKWCMDNGWVKGMRVDRIDTTKDYAPDNCCLGTLHTYKSDRNRKIKESAKQFREIKEIKKKIGGDESKISSIYNGMRTRCYNENSDSYKYYGGRGIKICEEWLGKYGYLRFYMWAMENGWELGLSIDRINVNGNYEPSNCRWVTMEVQARNKRNSKPVIYKGEETTVCAIERKEGINSGLLRTRINKGMTIEEAVEDAKKAMKRKQERKNGLR